MNAFEVLGLCARPLLDPGEVKAAHLRAMTHQHPDAAGAHGAALCLNEARDLLSRDRTRIRHLIELATGKPMAERGAVPQEIGDLFNPLAEVLGKVRSHLQGLAECESALEKAALMPEGLELFESLQQFQVRLGELRGIQTGRLRDLDAAWTAGRQEIRELEQVALALAFLDRWASQVDEQAFRLSETLL